MYIIAKDFCTMDLNTKTLKELKQIASFFRQQPRYAYYFEDYSQNKCKQTLTYFLEKAQKRVAIDVGLR